MSRIASKLQPKMNAFENPVAKKVNEAAGEKHSMQCNSLSLVS